MLKDLVPIGVALVALAGTAFNLFWSARLARQKSISDARLAELTSSLAFETQEKWAAAQARRANVQLEVQQIFAVIEAIQQGKDRLHAVRSAIETPGSTLKASVLQAVKDADKALQNAFAAIGWMDRPEVDKPHMAKTCLLKLVGPLEHGLAGATYVDGATPDVERSLARAIDTLREGQEALRDSVARRNSLLGSSLL